MTKTNYCYFLFVEGWSLLVSAMLSLGPQYLCDPILPCPQVVSGQYIKILTANSLSVEILAECRVSKTGASCSRRTTRDKVEEE